MAKKTQKIEQSADELFERIRIACNPIRFEILKRLAENGWVNANELGMIRSKHHHFQQLLKGAMVTQEGTGMTTVYKITPIGRDVIRRFEP